MREEADSGDRPETYDHVVKKNLNVERPANLRSKVANGIETATTPPYGPVRLGIPSDILAAEFFAPPITVSPKTRTVDNVTGIERTTQALAAAEKPVVYIGRGTHRSSNGPGIAREFVTELNALVVASLKRKGVFPEDEPQFMGATGSHLSAGARRVLDAADTVLALGTDFDDVPRPIGSSRWARR